MQGKTVPEATVEFAVETLWRVIKRLIVVIVLLILALIGTNVGWIIYESQYADIVTEQTVSQEADNGANRFIGGDYYGETNDKNHNETES